MRLVRRSRFKILLMASAGWMALTAAPVQGATCARQIEQVRQNLTEAELSSSERREYRALLEAAQAMQRSGDEQVCIDILNRTQGLLTRRASAEPVTGAATGGEPARATRYAALKDAKPLSQIARFEGIRDLGVVNSKGERLGNIVDLVVDFDDHQVQYALLSMSTGPFGDDKLYPVPIDVLRIGDDPDGMQRAGSADEAASAPRGSAAPTPPAGASIDMVPAAAANPAPPIATATAPAAAPAPLAEAGRRDGTATLGALAQMRVDELVGSEVKNNRDESVGTIDAVILPPGAAGVDVVLSVGGFLGIGDKAVAVPLDRLTTGEDGLRFKTAVTEDELKTLPAAEVSDQDRLPDDTVIAEVVPPPAPLSSAGAGQLAPDAQAMATDGASPAPATAEAAVDRREPGAGPADAADGPEDPLAHKVLVLDIDRATLERAPGFSDGAYPDLADAEWHRTVLAFYEDVLHIDGKSAKTKSD